MTTDDFARMTPVQIFEKHDILVVSPLDCEEHRDTKVVCNVAYVLVCPVAGTLFFCKRSINTAVKREKADGHSYTVFKLEKTEV